MSPLNYLSKMYYIVDGSGNFYRLSSSGQLIAAPGREEAEIFTFVDANRKIGGGKKSKFYHTIEVDEVMKMDQQFTESSEEKVDAANDKIVTTFVDNNDNESGSAVVPEEMEVQSEEEAFDISQINWMECLEYLCSILDGLEEYKTDLASRQLGYDLKMQDLMHYVELCEMDDNKRLDIMDLITETRQCRRDVKDEIQRIEYFQQAIGTSTNASKCKNGIRQMEKLATRTYHPRKDPDLFAGAEYHMSRELPFWNKKQMAKVKAENNNACYEDDYYTEENYQEECLMELERIDTVFDGRDNDWLSFARKQKEFYDNACQHMTNLEIDIRTIDAMIEEILVKVEDANFNVTQGYRVFKELKDLRNEKKDKLKELDVLRALTECFDCRSMSEALEYSVQEMEQIYGTSKVEMIQAASVSDDQADENVEAIAG